MEKNKHGKRLVKAVLIFAILNVAININTEGQGTAQNIKQKAKFAIYPQFEDARDFKDGLAEVKIKGKWGVIDKDGKWIAKPIYDKVDNLGRGIVKIEMNGKKGFVFKNGKVIKPRFDIVASSFTDEDMVCVRMNDKYGFIGYDGSVIEPKYEEICFGGNIFKEELAGVRYNELYGYINRKGKWVIKPQFNAAFNFYNGLAAVKLYGKWGYINKEGAWVILPQFDNAWPFNEQGVAIVRSEGKNGIIDKEGDWVIEPRFDYIIGWKGNRFYTVEIYGKWGCIDINGKWVINPEYDDIDFLTDRLVMIGKGKTNETNVNKRLIAGVYWIADVVEKKILNQEFYVLENGRENGKEIKAVGNGIIAVKQSNGKYILIKYGLTVIEKEFDDISYFSEGIAQVYEGDYLGFIDEEGEWIIPPKYNTSTIKNINEELEMQIPIAGDFKEGLAALLDIESIESKVDEIKDSDDVLKHIKYGYIDKTGKWVIQPQFTLAGNFSEGLALVVVNGKCGYIENPLLK